MEAWRSAFTDVDMKVAQLLLTLDDTEDRRRYVNARNTLMSLIELRVTPIVNENDTIATAEIRYGDNDRLAAHAAQLAGADLLVMLSDVDGLYDADPRKSPGAAHIAFAKGVSREMEAMASGPNTERATGSGGMKTKLEAAKIANAAGCAAIIADGAGDNPLRAICDGARASLIAPDADPLNARRRWIGGRIKPGGVIIVDDGAAEALRGGASLLAAGIRAVDGQFQKGDAVTIVDQSGRLCARGLVALDAADVDRIKGLKSDEANAILGYRRRPAIVDHDDLVLIVQEDSDQ